MLLCLSIFYLFVFFYSVFFYIPFALDLSCQSYKHVLFLYFFVCLFVLVFPEWSTFDNWLHGLMMCIAIKTKMSLAGKGYEHSYHSGYSFECKTYFNIYANAVLTVYPYHNGRSLCRLLFGTLYILIYLM